MRQEIATEMSGSGKTGQGSAIGRPGWEKVPLSAQGSGLEQLLHRRFTILSEKVTTQVPLT